MSRSQVRPGGRWGRDTSPAHIAEAIAGSHQALSGGTRPIQLWQIHNLVRFGPLGLWIYLAPIVRDLGVRAERRGQRIPGGDPRASGVCYRKWGDSVRRPVKLHGRADRSCTSGAATGQADLSPERV